MRRGPAVSQLIIAIIAFAFSLWAIGGAGRDVVYWGFLLMIAGLPVYILMRRHHAPKVMSMAPHDAAQTTDSAA